MDNVKWWGKNDLSEVIASQDWILLDIDKAGLQDVLQVIWAYSHKWPVHQLWTPISLSKY